jgi:hypothetical protein
MSRTGRSPALSFSEVAGSSGVPRSRNGWRDSHQTSDFPIQMLMTDADSGVPTRCACAVVLGHEVILGTWVYASASFMSRRFWNA